MKKMKTIITGLTPFSSILPVCGKRWIGYHKESGIQQ